jgi:hypothetical protein
LIDSRIVDQIELSVEKLRQDPLVSFSSPRRIREYSGIFR